ncbi:MAG: hypothetical protein FJ143_10205 [Deltaproteobacteria bacterium]|nr:hypothetical protein [Deltaproteobacteria bacterium]
MLAAVMHACTAVTYGRAARLFPGPTSESRLIGSLCGELAGAALPLMARWPMAVVGSTALLVTAGYTFNEVFVRWFPNLGFSFLLLACLAVINLANERIWIIFQGTFLAVAMLGLLTLVAVGLLMPATPLAETPAVVPSHSSMAIGVNAFSLFLGFDLAVYLSHSWRPPTVWWIAGLMLSAIGLLLWGWVSAQHVAALRLAESSLPHMLVAKTIFGEHGRWLMGSVGIAGTCAAVNLLFRGTTQATLAVAGSVARSKWVASRWRRKLPTLVLAALVAAMFGTGMGGESILDAWLAGSLWLWLASHAVLHAALIVQRLAPEHRPVKAVSAFAHAYIALVIIGAVLLGALMLSPAPRQQIVFMTVVGLGTVILVYLYRRYPGV